MQVIEGCWHPLPSKRPTFPEVKVTFKELSKQIPPDVPKSNQQAVPVQQPLPSRSVAQAAPQQQAPKPGQYYVQSGQHGGASSQQGGASSQQGGASSQHRHVQQGYQGQGQVGCLAPSQLFCCEMMLPCLILP